jgi:signal transduction histidine kinase
MIQRIRGRPPAAYALALLLSIGAFAIEYWLWHSGLDRDLFVLSYGVILLSAWLGGIGPSLLATAASSLLTVGLLMSPADSVGAGLDDVLRVGVFVLVALLTSSLLDRERRALDLVATALRERRDLMAGIAHDLRSPLAVILGNVQLVQRSIGESNQGELDPVTRRLGAIERAGRQIASQVDELLDTARLEAGQQLDLQRVPVDLVRLAGGLTQAHSDSVSTTAIIFESAVEELTGEWDAMRISRVLDNLLTNAIKYSPTGSEVRVRARREGAWAVVEVIDQGIGIPPEDLPHIFDRFQRGQNVGQVAANGAGVGLASARLIVEQHGGGITVQSEEGVGSTFGVYLPLPEADANPVRPPDREHQRIGSH